MNKFKEILEPDMYEIQCKIDQIGSCFHLTRNFSVQISSHLKIMCHLINELIDSDDKLTVEDKRLHLPPNFSIIQKSKPNNMLNQMDENSLATHIFNKFVKEDSHF